MALKNLLIFLAIVSFIFVLVVFGLYMYNFSYLGLSPSPEVWAQFGDYMGGTLNPMLAFFAFIALLYTIRLQSSALQMSKDELEATRKELTETRIAQQEQSKSLELQNKATELQIFENTFFSLLKNTNTLLEKINIEKDVELNERIEELLKYTTIPKNEDAYEQLVSLFENINKGFIKRYFIMLYQLLKFINENVKDKKKYTNIVRANIESRILALLLINCSIYNYSNYKNYLRDSNFFEHLNIEENYTIYHINYDLSLLVFLIRNEFKDLNYFGDNEIIRKELSALKDYN